LDIRHRKVEVVLQEVQKTWMGDRHGERTTWCGAKEDWGLYGPFGATVDVPDLSNLAVGHGAGSIISRNQGYKSYKEVVMTGSI